VTKAQKRLKELRERQSKERQKMAEFGLADSLSDEQRTELDGIESGTPDLERQIRAAQVAVDAEESEQRTETRTAEPDTEMRERIELRSKATLTRFITAALSGRMVDGAEAELRAAAAEGAPDYPADGIPLELWDVPEARTEQRVDAPTGTPDSVGVNLDPIRPMIFANSIAPRLNIAMPRVRSGTFATATINRALSAGAREKGAEQNSTAAAFAVSTATPKSVSARMSIRIEDVAAVGVGNFESALRENLSMALSDELDRQVISGDGAAPNLAGILHRLDDPTAPMAIPDFDAFVAAFADGIEGLWASTMKDVAIVAGPATYKLSARTFRDRVIDEANKGAASLGDTSFADYAMAKFGGWWTNKRMPDPAGNDQQAILHRKGRMGVRTAVCPHWNVISIDDIYSGSGRGERFFTMHVLLGDVILTQPDAYAQVAFKVAA